MSLRDWGDLNRWNSVIPSADGRCLQELVLAQGALQPQRLAVCAWDGDLTYKQLMALSASLARRLSLFGVSRGSLVPICMEKSWWTIVAILGVLRAGGTCVLLDPKYPRQRLQDIVHSVSGRLLIHDPLTASLTQGLTPSAMCASPDFTKRLKRDSHKRGRSLSLVQLDTSVDSYPDDLAFVIFTSGSTGRPKGIAMQHSALSTSIRDHSPGLKVNGCTRALHLSSYAFDVSIYEIFTTLAAGGCICVPLELERMNQLAKYANPAEVPCLTTLVLGGEAVTQQHVDTWAPSPSALTCRWSLINGYSPAEATICAVGPIAPQNWRLGTFGHVIGGVGWVTKPSDPSQLVAIGAIGELLLEGPFLAQGYLNMPDVTATSFIDPPPWRLRLPFACQDGNGGEKIRLYRTGDLVRYLEDGSIQYLGPRDTQVKIREQRVDLGEVEAQIQRWFPSASASPSTNGAGGAKHAQVVAGPISLPMAKGTASTLLVAFIERPEAKPYDLLVSPVDSDFQQAMSRLQAHLESTMPPYMVTSVYIPVSQIPMTVTGKSDRRFLRDCVRNLRPQDLQRYRMTNNYRTIVTSMSSAAARCLRAIWPALLDVPCEMIGAESTFIVHGGDSVMAMRLLAIARREGFRFSVADVLNNGTLSILAMQQDTSSSSREPSTPPSSTSSQGTKLDIHNATGRRHPTTDTQAFLTQRYPWTHWRFKIQGEADTDRLRTACTRLITAHGILRARFERDPSGGAKPVQILMQGLNNPLHTVTVPMRDGIDQFTKALAQSEQTMDVLSASAKHPPTRFTLVSNTRRIGHVLLVRLSDAQYDGICVPKIFADL
ncbi:hypothetical protein BJY00DRAFT_310259 [Aspergillus carlsbadensis]|nr:hypothetical protein BJY00DRAFT_310259 [Aspergillus carlsbadensis]